MGIHENFSHSVYSSMKFVITADYTPFHSFEWSIHCPSNFSFYRIWSIILTADIWYIRCYQKLPFQLKANECALSKAIDQDQFLWEYSI